MECRECEKACRRSFFNKVKDESDFLLITKGPSTSENIASLLGQAKPQIKGLLATGIRKSPSSYIVKKCPGSTYMHAKPELIK
jgi:hypothetical protein